MIKEYIVKKSIGNNSGRVFSQKEVGELVRCKDCEYYVCKPGYLINSIEDCRCYCGRIENGAVLVPVKDVDYCSRGIKRKEQEHGKR